MPEPILSVRNLNVKFSLRGQTLHAIRDVSLDVMRGESLAIVGESGSGKSVFVKSFMGLNDKNGWIDSGEILYEGKNLAALKSEKEWGAIRGGEIAMVMQDPMTSLNPLMTIGAQILEAIELHQRLHGADGGVNFRFCVEIRKAEAYRALRRRPKGLMHSRGAVRAGPGRNVVRREQHV